MCRLTKTYIRFMFWGLILLFLMKPETKAVVEFQNIECKSVDKEFTVFEYCFIKAVNRSYKYVAIKAKLLQIPVNNAMVNVAVKKKANGYKPFLYNFTVDLCKFLKDRNHLLFGYFYGFFKDRSNINHTCPYSHDIIAKIDLSLVDHQVTKVLPVPDGEYALFAKWIVYNKVRVLINAYVKIR